MFVSFVVPYGFTRNFDDIVRVSNYVHLNPGLQRARPLWCDTSDNFKSSANGIVVFVVTMLIFASLEHAHERVRVQMHKMSLKLSFIAR